MRRNNEGLVNSGKDVRFRAFEIVSKRQSKYVKFAIPPFRAQTGIMRTQVHLTLGIRHSSFSFGLSPARALKKHANGVFNQFYTRYEAGLSRRL